MIPVSNYKSPVSKSLGSFPQRRVAFLFRSPPDFEFASPQTLQLALRSIAVLSPTVEAGRAGGVYAPVLQLRVQSFNCTT